MSPHGAASNQYGRVDHDGTVYLITPSGERIVGSWQAGSPEEGLAHFVRRYDDIETDVTLLATRLQSKAATPQHTLEQALRLQKSLSDVSVIGDLAALEAKLTGIIERAREAAEVATAAKRTARMEAVARKEEIVAHAEGLADSTRWKATGDEFVQLLQRWKDSPTTDRGTDKALWKRFAAARDEFNKRRGTHFAGLDAARKAAAQRKEELTAEAEALAPSTDWQDTAATLKQLMAEWKGLPRLAKEAEDRLWARFRGAQDAFFTQRSEAFSTADEDRKRRRAVQQVVRDQQREHAKQNNPLLNQMREQVERTARQVERARASGDEAALAEAERSLAGKQRVLQLAEQAGKSAS
ncbi:MAG: DUF349 domain-containing protein [Mycobacteriales bacterium]